MIISNLRKSAEQGVARVEATVEWESSNRPPLELFVETEERFAEHLVSDANAWLGAALIPAWKLGETRVRVEGRLCPYLCERTKIPTGFLAKWFPDDFGPPPAIEAGEWGYGTSSNGRSVALLSCGIDSLATLRWNRLHVPADHPYSIDSVIYFSFDPQPEPSLERLRESTGARRSAVENVARVAGVTPIPVRSNLWWLIDDGWFYAYKWHGSLCASILGFFAAGFRRGYVASSHCPKVVQPHGSHPLLDPYFSSAHFSVEHDLFSMGRLEKTALVGEWREAVNYTRVCQNDSGGGENCCTCEKCIRTITTLAALGLLDNARPAFPYADLTPELIMTIDQYDMIRGQPHYLRHWYEQLVPLLKNRNFSSVADALETVLESASKPI